MLSNIQTNYLENKFNNIYNGINNAKIVATIISEKKETTYKASYIIKVESVNDDNIFNGTRLIVYTAKSKKLEYGDKVLLNGNFEQAKTATNFKAFNYREYLKSQKIYGLFNVDEIELIKKHNLNSWLLWINNTRIKIKNNLHDLLGEKANIVIRPFTSEINLI